MDEKTRQKISETQKRRWAELKDTGKFVPKSDRRYEYHAEQMYCEDIDVICNRLNEFAFAGWRLISVSEGIYIFEKENAYTK